MKPQPAAAGAGAAGVDPAAANPAASGTSTSAGGWVRLEEVIKYLTKIDQNREGHDVEISAKSNTAGIHKFEITVKEKPMMQKANGMGQAASREDVIVRLAGWDTKLEAPKSEMKKPAVKKAAVDVKKAFPEGFLKSMGLA